MARSLAQRPELEVWCNTTHYYDSLKGEKF